MPVWLSVLLALGGSTLIGLVVKEVYDMIKTKNKKANQFDEQKAWANTKETIRDIIREEITPVKEKLSNIEGDIDTIKKDVETTKGGLQAELRHDIRNSCRRCIQQGYKTEEDVMEIDALHKQYEELGTNGLTNTLYDKFLLLDLVPNDYKKPTPKRKSSKTGKTVLLEEKK